MLKYIGINGIKGRRTGIVLDKPFLLLAGDMGSGKSAVIDGVHLAMNLPTRYGTTGLDRLSPNGEWTVTLEFDHPRVKRLLRTLKKNRSVFEVNAMKVDRDEYNAAVREILDVEPHHVDLGAFTGLSGAKRAEMFADMLESSQVFNLDEMLGTVLRTGLVAFVGQEVGDDQFPHIKPLMDKLRLLSGTPTKVAESVRLIANSCAADERDAKTQLEGLMQKGGAVSHGMTGEELKKKIAAADEKIGAMKAKLDSVNTDRERYDASKRVLDDTLAAIEKDRGLLANTKAEAARLNDRQAQFDLAKLTLDTHTATEAAMKAEHEKLTVALAELTDEKKKLERGLALLQDLLKQPWKVDHDWLDEEMGKFLSELFVEPASVRCDAKVHDDVMKFAKEIVAEVLGGDTDKIKVKIESIESQIVAQKELVKASKEQIDSFRATITTATADFKNKTDALGSCKKAVEDVPTITERIGKLDASRATLESSVQRSGLDTDPAVVEGQKLAMENDRTLLASQLKELEDSMAMSGQVEAQRLVSTRAGVVRVMINKLADLAQRWRDDIVRERLNNVMTPFIDAFSTIFGEEMGLKHHSEGEGRSTEFYFTINRRGFPVQFDLLSDGETVLTAAAFLTALQRIKAGPGRFLSLNSEALSSRGLQQLLAAVPKLGLDCAIVANNNAKSLQNVPESWQMVDMDQAPPLR